MDYKTSGVDIIKGRSFVEYIKALAPNIGGFSGMMEIPSGYEKPVLVSGADGVGTKINICRIFNDYTTIGQDLVAMCVNDVICSGAKPLYFLDYISTKFLHANVNDIVYGVNVGCVMAGMELLGGETAEHYRANDYDLAGFCTGIVEKNEIVDGSNIRPGDVVIGIESSGLHSNGYSLIRDMLFRHKIYLSDMPELLNPTIIYAPLVKRLLDKVPVMGMAHITGGGIPGNLPRCIPEGLKVDVDYNSWPFPELFSKIMLAGEIPEEDMKKTFNMGIGYCVVVPTNVTEETQSIIKTYGLNSWIIGEVTHI